MSAESWASPLALWRTDLQSARTLRYAVGSTIAMAVAMGIDWQLAFLTPVLTVAFLKAPSPAPPLKAGLAFVGITALASLAGLTVTLLLSYPLIYFPMMGLILFLLFYAKAGGGNPLLIMLLLIGVTAIPTLGVEHSYLSLVVARGLITGAAATIAVVWLAHALAPDPMDSSYGTPKAASTAALTLAERAETAAVATLVVLPLVILFYSFQLTGALIVLAFVALLSSEPAFTRGFQGGKALLIGNALGGAVAIAFYEILVVVPEYLYLVLLTLLGGLIFGAKIFSGSRAAPLYAMAFSTALLIVGSTTSSYGEAGAKAYTRVAQIFVAVVYLVVAFGMINSLRKKRGS